MCFCTHLSSIFIVHNVYSIQPSFQVLAAIPERCSPQVCDYYAAWKQSDDLDFVDFRLEGNVQGWIALGLSEDKRMVCTYIRIWTTCKFICTCTYVHTYVQVQIVHNVHTYVFTVCM